MKRMRQTRWPTLSNCLRKAFTTDSLSTASFRTLSFKVAVHKGTERVVPDTKLIVNLPETTNFMTEACCLWHMQAEIQEAPSSLSVTTEKTPSISIGTIPVSER